jgi:hypothetical protein
MPPFSFLKNFKETRSERSNFAMPCSPEELGKGENTSGGNIGVTMRTINTIALLAFFAVGVFAQTAASYDETRPASEGLQAVSLKGKWGFIDGAGKVIVQPKYARVDDFSQGFATVDLKEEGPSTGLIDKTGKVIVPTKYDGAKTESCPKENPIFCYGDMAVFYTNSTGIGKVGKEGLFNKAGKEVVSSNLGYYFCDPINGGVAFYTFPKSGPSKMGYVSKAGKVTQPTKYTTGEYQQCPEEITDGLVSVPMPKSKQGVLDINTGKEIVPPKYSSAYHIGSGFIAVEDDEKDTRMIFNKAGKMIASGKEGYGGGVTGFPEGVAFSSKDKMGILDANGKEIIPPKYDEIVSFQDGKAKVCINKKCGFVDKTGTESGWETKSGTSSEIAEEANKATQDAAKADAKTDAKAAAKAAAKNK